MTVGRTHQPWRRLLVTTAAALLCSASLSAQQQPVYVSDPASGNQVAGHTLNLRDADISSLIATVSEITGRNFIIDPRVTGKVNVISNRPMSADEVYDVFLSVLRVNGFAAVGAGNIIKIVPEALATQDAPASPGASAPDALVTRIVPVNHLSPAELVQLLRPLVPQSAQLLPHPTSSTLLISDRAANVERIQQLIARLDQASASEVEVVPLEHANAAEVVRTLTLLQPASATDGSGNKLAADERTNSILIAGDRSKRLRLKALIAHLDTPLSGSETLQVIYLRYADAEQLVPILETALATFGGKQAGGEDSTSKPAIQAHKETNSLVINAPPAVFRDLKDVVRQLDIRRAQVLIEALVAEVSDNIAREIGIQWQATDNDFGDNGVLGGTNFPGANGTGGIIGARLAECGFDAFERDDGIHPYSGHDPNPRYNDDLRAAGLESEKGKLTSAAFELGLGGFGKVVDLAVVLFAFSTLISLSAIDSAARVYSAALSTLPAFCASDAMISA